MERQPQILNSGLILKTFTHAFLFLLLNKMLVITAGIYKMLVRIANSEDPDQTASALFVNAFLVVN